MMLVPDRGDGLRSGFSADKGVTWGRCRLAGNYQWISFLVWWHI